MIENKFIKNMGSPWKEGEIRLEVDKENSNVFKEGIFLLKHIKNACTGKNYLSITRLFDPRVKYPE